MSKKEELRSMIQIHTWSELRGKLNANKLLALNYQADLMQVAMAVEQDNDEVLLHYMNNGALKRPTEVQIQKWNANPEKEFQSIEVARFTLIQELVKKKSF